MGSAADIFSVRHLKRDSGLITKRGKNRKVQAKKQKLGFTGKQ
jgi:hypothetical protein